MTAFEASSLREVAHPDVSVLAQFGIDISDLAAQLANMTNHDYLNGRDVGIHS